MDAHVFRRVGAILANCLHTARLERIHEPVPGITAFSLFVSGKKRCLLFRRHRSVPLLFLTDKSPLPNPAFPPASVMRLRKYAEGRILGEARCNWVERQIAFALPGPDNTVAAWLLLDCKHGPAIVYTLPEHFGNEPAWPNPAALPALIRPGDESAPWKEFRVLTPFLRQTLTHLSPEDTAALLVDLEAGNGDLFWYTPVGDENAPPGLASAWPLPQEISGKTLTENATPATAMTVLPLLEAMQLPLLLADAGEKAVQPAVRQDKAALKRRKRLVAKLEEEKARLEAMLALGDEARLLQSHLWRLPPDAHCETVTVPLNPADPDGAGKTIRLNSLISVTENMRIMFRKAAKATRGLGMLEERLTLAREMPSPSPAPPLSVPLGGNKKNTDKKPLFSPSLIQEFVSSDGFTLWRGRNAEGNRALLKLARPFDLWFHVEDGPSAHLLLRRDHAGQDIPERTLHEAAVLVGLKSWRKNDPKAPVMTALAKHVQPIKGAAPGTVRVQERLRTILASLDDCLETSLRANGTASGSKEG